MSGFFKITEIFLFNASVEVSERKTGNLRYMQRTAARQIACKAIGTKSQQPLVSLGKLMNTKLKKQSRKQSAEEKKRQFHHSQQKRKAKHRER